MKTELLVVDRLPKSNPDTAKRGLFRVDHHTLRAVYYLKQMKLRMAVLIRSTVCYVASAVVGLCCPVFAQDDPCHHPAEALVSTDWQSIKPSHFPVEVMFSSPEGWNGVDRVFGTGEHLQARWRSAIPFLVPTMVQSFEGSNTYSPIHNSTPVFYLHATEIASFLPPFDADKVRLLRLTVRHDHRELPVSKGITKFTFAAGSPSHFLVPVGVRRLSQTMMEIKPRDQLAPGQYLIAIGNQENEGFEFEINCTPKQ